MLRLHAKQVKYWDYLYFGLHFSQQKHHKESYVTINKDRRTSTKTIGVCRAEFSEAFDIFESNNVVMLGGAQRKVFSDHTFLKKLKYNHGYGKENNQQILGSAEDGSGLFRVDVVANQRIPQTCHALEQQTHPGTIHVTDEAKCFKVIPDELADREHRTCNHSGTMNKVTGVVHYFVDQNTYESTNPAEGLFGRLKQWLIQHPTVCRNHKVFRDNIGAFQFRYNRTGNLSPQVFVNLLYVLSQVYAPNKDKMERYHFIYCNFGF